MRSYSRRSLLSFFAVLLASTGAAEAASTAPLRSPAVWVNGGPYNLNALKGKVVVMWFFEEQCPVARAKWPSLHTLAKSYAEKPVVFMGVNSGNPRGTVNAYSRQNGLSWPIAVDADRGFEQACGLKPITLQNIYQLCVIGPDGTLKRARWDNPASAIDPLLARAAWTIDPKEVPESLRSAWRKIELGDYASATTELKKSAASEAPEVRAGAQKLSQAIDKKIVEELAAAEALQKEGNLLDAYLQYECMVRQFKGHPQALEADNRRKTLATSPQLKKELSGQSALTKARKLLISDKPAVRDRAAESLKKVIADYSGTQAAKDAQAILEPPAAKSNVIFARP